MCLRIHEEASLLHIHGILVPEIPDLPAGVLWARSLEHLGVRPHPLVRDPLGADHDRTPSVPGHGVVASRLVHIPPDDDGALPGPDEGPHQREDSVAARHHVAEVAHDGRDPVAGVHVEHLPVLDVALVHHHLVVVGVVLPGQPVVGHLVQLRVVGALGLKVHEVVQPPGDPGRGLRVFLRQPGLLADPPVVQGAVQGLADHLGALKLGRGGGNDLLGLPVGDEFVDDGDVGPEAHNLHFPGSVPVVGLSPGLVLAVELAGDVRGPEVDPPAQVHVLLGLLPGVDDLGVHEGDLDRLGGHELLLLGQPLVVGHGVGAVGGRPGSPAVQLLVVDGLGRLDQVLEHLHVQGLDEGRDGHHALDLGLLEGLEHDVDAGAEEHLVGALDPDLERVPDGHLPDRLELDVAGLEDALLHEGGGVELVVVVEADDADGDSVQIGGARNVVSLPPGHDLPDSLGELCALLGGLLLLQGVFHNAPTHSNVPAIKKKKMYLMCYYYIILVVHKMGIYMLEKKVCVK